MQSSTITVPRGGSYRELEDEGLFEVRVYLKLVGPATNLEARLQLDGKSYKTITMLSLVDQPLTAAELQNNVGKRTIFAVFYLNITKIAFAHVMGISGETSCDPIEVSFTKRYTNHGTTRSNGKVTKAKKQHGKRKEREQIIDPQRSAERITVPLSFIRPDISSSTSTIHDSTKEELKGWLIPNEHFYTLKRYPKRLFLGLPFIIRGPKIESPVEIHIFMNGNRDVSFVPQIIADTDIDGGSYVYYCVGTQFDEVRSIALGSDCAYQSDGGRHTLKVSKLQIWTQGYCYRQTRIRFHCTGKPGRLGDVCKERANTLAAQMLIMLNINSKEKLETSETYQDESSGEEESVSGEEENGEEESEANSATSTSGESESKEEDEEVRENGNVDIMPTSSANRIIEDGESPTTKRRKNVVLPTPPPTPDPPKMNVPEHVPPTEVEKPIPKKQRMWPSLKLPERKLVETIHCQCAELCIHKVQNNIRIARENENYARLCRKCLCKSLASIIRVNADQDLSDES